MYINREVVGMPYRIWFRQFDDNGEMIGEGVYNKSYKCYGHAWNAAKKQYGDMDNISYRIGKQNPWVEHCEKVPCGLCGETFDVLVTSEGYGHTAHVSLGSYKQDRPIGADICPDCHDSIAGFIQSLRKTEEVPI